MRSQDSCFCFFLFMVLQQGFQSFSRQERCISADDQRSAFFVLQHSLRLQDSVPCSQLLRLQYIFRTIPQASFNSIRTVPYNCHYLFNASSLYLIHDVLYHWFSANCMQYFVKLTFHARSLTSSKYDCKTISHKQLLSFHFIPSTKLS